VVRSIAVTIERNPNRKVLAAAAALALAAAARFAAATAGSPVITPDSFDFGAQSRLSLLGAAFWGSQHPPLLPLVWKLYPHALARALWGCSSSTRGRSSC
jgi:hypothetical protein